MSASDGARTFTLWVCLAWLMSTQAPHGHCHCLTSDPKQRNEGAQAEADAGGAKPRCGPGACQQEGDSGYDENCVRHFGSPFKVASIIAYQPSFKPPQT